MSSDVLEFTSNATHMQQVRNKDIDMYRTFFSRNTGECPFLCVSSSGAADSEYIEMMLVSIEIYLLDGIACQRDMSKIALQSAKAYDFMKQFVVDGRNLLERFLESIGQMVEKVRDGFRR